MTAVRITPSGGILNPAGTTKIHVLPDGGIYSEVGAAGNSAAPGAGTLTFTGYAPAVTTAAAGAHSATPGVGALGITGYAPTVVRTTGALLTTPVLKNNTGTILANETGVVVNVYDATTGALVLHKTGATSNGSGIVAVRDDALVASTTYAYEVVLSSNGRRLPTVAAT
jgi:hypothetical protein